MTTSPRNIEFAMAARGRERRRELGLTVGEIAKRMNRDTTWVHLMERDGCSTLTTIRRWARALEMSPKVLAFGEEV